MFALGTRTHQHLEFDLVPAAEPRAVAAAVAALREPAVAGTGVNVVTGFGPQLWRLLAPDDYPTQLRPLPAIEGLPRTPHDVWVWLHGTGDDARFDATRAVVSALAPVATLAHEVRGFVYHDARDLTGFIDGTENPPVEEAPSVALVAHGPGAGGSFVITQRWVHRLDAFQALPVAEQEAVIGRTKADSVELPADRLPDDAHIARMVVEVDGQELEIFRRSVPYGDVAEHGLFFVAFSADQSRFDAMLHRMYGTDDGTRDHLLEFSTPVTGATYFAPSLEALQRLVAWSG